MSCFSETFPVRWHETGRDERLQVATAVQYLGHAAGLHAEQLGFSLEALGEWGITWVLARMKVSFQSRPRRGETLVLDTWPYGGERMLFRRDYRIRTASGDPVLTASSWWVVFGLESRKVEPLPQFMKERFAAFTEPALDGAEVRIPVLKDPSAGPEFRARLSDIDWNGHVNNGRFVDFVLEDAFGRGRTEDGLQGLEIAFRAEAVLNDTLQAFSEPEGESGLLHSIRRCADGQELVRARTLWGPGGSL
ncbi:hypothetical protein IHV25_02890 [Phaeovibrio sulfidiphilus]|uniref:Acyl-ACP thioesterase n=1 Tax=Phaeovibrio sulfidiphilus TaxID=1220600 RepID=A0A8J6YUE9_9PROT|nr:acyl-ACP thioesterase domain-containing protein [Phaeovibrio sulfidiphilus]MBE1236599.1 hypothetical protein [Phaeovibrio sulfidiphilus]